MPIISHSLKRIFIVAIALFCAAALKAAFDTERPLASANLSSNSYKDIWIWLLLLWAAKTISKKKSSQSSGLPLFDSYREDETKSRPSKT